MFKTILFILSLICLSSATPVQDAFKKLGIVTDILTVAPERLLKAIKN